MAAITEAVPWTTEQAVLRASVRMRNAVATPMKTTMAAIRACDDEMAQRCRTQEDSHLLAALPGAGTVYAARLPAAMGTDRHRWPTADARLGCSGGAPVVERRGQSTRLRWRYCCPKFLRPSCHAYAGASLQPSFWARADDMSPRA
jgi:hypothetical protein